MTIPMGLIPQKIKSISIISTTDLDLSASFDTMELI